MPSPFVYRSLQSIHPGFSVGTLRHVNSISFSFPASFFLRPMSTFFFVSGIVFSTTDVDFLPIF